MQLSVDVLHKMTHESVSAYLFKLFFKPFNYKCNSYKNNYASQSIQLESGWYKYRMGQKVILYIDIRTVFYEY
jgi:hypothetical protein